MLAHLVAVFASVIQHTQHFALRPSTRLLVFLLVVTVVMLHQQPRLSIPSTKQTWSPFAERRKRIRTVGPNLA